MSYAVLFPGQGSQTVGMGEELFELMPEMLVDVADRVLGWSLRDICLVGPEDELTRTEHAQPALFAVAYALWELLLPELPEPPSAAAGHSLGEYTALTAAGSITFDRALDVVSKRGLAMADAATQASSGMVALVGADVDLAESVAAARRELGGRLQVANINAPGQVVLAGSTDDIDWVVANGREHGVRRAIPLKVAGGFHSDFMEAAAELVGDTLETIDFGPPAFPVWSNTTARPHELDSLARTLREQVVSPVRFQESLEGMAGSGVDTFIHVGPGDVTAGMAKRSVPGATIHVVSTPGDIQAVATALG